MKDKPKDIPYCGVRKDKIDDFPKENINVDSLYLFVSFIKERYKIHLKKDTLKESAPWTDDKILKKYRFTNVRREHDRNTLWLINNITSNSNLSYEEKILNAILFRLYNKIETAVTLGIPAHMNEMKELAARTQNLPKTEYMTGAYMVSGMMREFRKNTKTTDSRLAVVRSLQYMYKFHILDYLKDDKLMYDQQQALKVLQSYVGISEFMAYQLFVDLTYIEEFPFSENHYTLAGPGAKLGLKYLFNDACGRTPEELIFWLRDNWKQLNQYLYQLGYKIRLNPKKLMIDLPIYDRKMNVMSLENCLCEFSKYYKTYNGLGRPRKKYDGG